MLPRNSHHALYNKLNKIKSEFHENFNDNAKQLTTEYDIHPTFIRIIEIMSGMKMASAGLGYGIYFDFRGNSIIS
jgi:hypothetical protein